MGRVWAAPERRMIKYATIVEAISPACHAETIGEQIGRYPSEGGYVFTAPEGGPVRHHNFMARHFYPSSLAVGMPDGLRFHD
jgi:hypothetical protein